VELPHLRSVVAPDFMGSKERSNKDYFAVGQEIMNIDKYSSKLLESTVIGFSKLPGIDRKNAPSIQITL
jgi:hypothetical protein